MPGKQWTAGQTAENRAARKVAERTRAVVLARLAEGEMDFDEVLALARENKAVGKIRLQRVLGALGWTHVEFVEAVTELDIPVDRNLVWLSSQKGQAALARLREFMVDTGVRPTAPEGFPFRAPGATIPVR